jgi:dihydrofolate reductase
MIAAYTHGRVIGNAGGQPWDLPNDTQYFKRITSGQTVVMGRTTFLSLDKPLPNRRNVVMTHDPDFAPEGVDVVHSRDEVMALAATTDLFIIGGENVYRQFLDVAQRLYLTEIDLEVAGDTFFPEWDHQAFKLISSQPGIIDAKNTLAHTFLIYERNTPINLHEHL